TSHLRYRGPGCPGFGCPVPRLAVHPPLDHRTETRMLPDTTIPESLRCDVEVLWNYHDMQHDLHPCDVGIGLGSHDLGVAVIATDLFMRGFFPNIVFTGANALTTIDRFPRGEAVHYREYAVENGVPAESVMIETQATNTAENLVLTRELLAE